MRITTQNEERDLRQHRQHRLRNSCLFCGPRKNGLIASRSITAASTDDVDGADAIFGTSAHGVSLVSDRQPTLFVARVPAPSSF